MALRFGPAMLALESEECRCKLLPVGEDGRKVLGEVPDLARQDFFAILPSLQYRPDNAPRCKRRQRSPDCIHELIAPGPNTYSASDFRG
jgi:hypothetical protein